MSEELGVRSSLLRYVGVIKWCKDTVFLRDFKIFF